MGSRLVRISSWGLVTILSMIGQHVLLLNVRHVLVLGGHHQVLLLDAVVHSTCPSAGALVTEFYTSVLIHSGQQLSKHVVRHMVASSGTASSSAATTTFS